MSRSLDSSFKKKIKVMVFVPGFIPSVTIGVLKPLAVLEKNGKIALKVVASYLRWFPFANLKWCDVAIFCRNMEEKDKELLYYLKWLGKRIIYEIDDNFEEIPLNTNIGLYHRNVKRLHILRRFFALSDLVRVYSSRMQYRASLHGATVKLVKSYFDFKLIQDCQRIHNNPKLIKIAYPISRVDDPNLESFFFKALRKILLKYQGKIELYLWRNSLPKEFADLKGVILYSKLEKYYKFIKNFYMEGFDIGLAPLLDGPFSNSKTNNKYREFGGCQIAGIYSDVLPYNDCIMHNETGILTKNTVESWVEWISRLIEDKTLREKIKENAKKDILINYNFKSAVECYWESIIDVMNAKIKSCEWLYKPPLKQVNAAFGSTGVSNSISYHSFIAAMKLLNGKNFLPYDINSISNDLFNIHEFPGTLIFIINSIEELIYNCNIFSIVTGVILDLSNFCEDMEEFKITFEKLQISTMISFLVNERQSFFIALANKWNFSYVVIKAKHTNIDNYFSLEGYIAAYLDLLEKNIHMQSNKEINSTWIKRKFERIIIVNIDRIKRLVFSLQWALGKRTS